MGHEWGISWIYPTVLIFGCVKKLGFSPMTLRQTQVGTGPRNIAWLSMGQIFEDIQHYCWTHKIVLFFEFCFSQGIASILKKSQRG